MMTKRICWRWAIVVALVLVPGVSHGNEGTILLTLKKAVAVSGPEILLSDVAELTGATEEARKVISGVKIYSFPPDGAGKVLTTSDIEDRLKKSFISLDNIKIAGSPRIVVSRKLNQITSEDLTNAVRDYIHENMLWNKEEVTLEFSRTFPDITLPDGEIEYKVTPNGGPNFIGNCQYTLRVLSNGVLKYRAVTSVKIRVFTKVVVSTRQLRRHNIVRSGDVEIQTRELKDTTRTPFTQIEEVIGQRVRMSVTANHMLWRSYFEEAPVISRNQMVSIVGRSGPILVTTRGKAIKEGRIGEYIQVMNLASRKMVEAKVIDSETVQIISSLGK